ncbi:nucleoside hydrolase [Halocynthiibacter namhaensis]|uniref:nucleoside hydrolase n=1 Tax=Halocynthiibacter namhaensis TaxID=1290553 RepID=UPI0005795A11|nr:nucleoside hydrolase [Halocynthiibacter namhaensis]
MKMIIDTDPGVDDAIAIALAHALPEIDLIGLTTVFGNTRVDQSSRNARFLLDMLGSDAVVAEGASKPWNDYPFEPSAWVHGSEGFGDIVEVPQIGTNHDQNAAEYLVEMARKHPGDLTVCAIGPLTNIADALKLDPSFAQNLDKLVIMGGNLHCPGNITAHAEANIFHDPAAADAVFASGLNTVMVGLDVTLQTLLVPGDFAALAASSPKIGGFLNRISEFYLGFYKEVANLDGCPMHDAAAVLACSNPDWFGLEHTGLRVSQDGETVGATLADPNRPKVAVAIEIDAVATLTKLKTHLAALH